MSSYTALEPSFIGSLDLPALSFTAGQAGSLAGSMGLIFTLGIMVTVVVGAGTLAYAGMKRIQPSEQAVSQSNKIAKRAVLGTLGVLCLYVLLRTFNADLVTGDVGLEGLRVQGGAGITTPATQAQPAPPATSAPTDGTESANRATLQSAGITVNNPPCTPPQTRGCTNLAGLRQETINMLIQLKNTCPGASIVITGGTEPGHKSHGPGKYPVDLRFGNSALDTCIRNFPRGPNLNYCHGTWKGLGYTFCDEASVAHWHVFK